MKLKSFVIILLTSLLLGWQLLRPGYYSMHDDLQIMRLYQMDRCFRDGQLPCRWAPDLGQNYGQPMFNYYSALPYYLGEGIHLIGFSFVDTSKFLFLASIFLSGLFAFFLARELVKSETAALLAALVYMTAPYHAVDIFVRGAMSESWGLVFIPLVLFALIRLCRRPSHTTAIILALALAAFLTTHNLTVLLAASAILVFGLYFFLTNPKKAKQAIYLLAALVLGVGLASFFLLPVIFEQNLIQTQYLISDYFDFRSHFVTFAQLFTVISGAFGPSRFNSFQYPETMPFFVGIVPLAALLLSPVALYLFRKEKQTVSLIILTFSLALLYLFMTHARSVFLWQPIPALRFVQFPWRFLGPASLFLALSAGFFFDGLPLSGKTQIKLLALIVALLVGTNFRYFRFEKYYPQMTDAAKLSGSEYAAQVKGALLDYLPITARQIPEAPAPSQPEIQSGTATINYFDRRSNYFSSEFDVYSDEATVQFPVMFFPGWQVYQNRSSQPVDIAIDNDYGLVTVKLTTGHQLIQGFFDNTPVRAIGNGLTFISGLILTFWFIVSRKERQ